MNSERCTRLILGLVVLILSLLTVSSLPARAQEVIGYSELTFNKSAGQVDTWSETDMDANTAAQYDAYVAGYVFINGTEVNAGKATGNPYAAGGSRKR